MKQSKDSMKVYEEKNVEAMIGVSKPVLLIDSAYYTDSPYKIVTECQVNGDLFFWQHHFLNNPVMPGTYILEMIAQSAALFVMVMTSATEVPIIVSATNIRFLREVKPGAALRTEVVLKNRSENYYTTQGKVYCESKNVCKAELVHYVRR